MPTDFAATYARMADEELLALAAESEKLTDEASSVLRVELRQRGLDARAAEAVEQRAAEKASQRPPPSLPRLVTVATFTDPLKAHLVRTRLQAGGIECVVADEDSIRMCEAVPVTLGYIKLRVYEPDAERAAQLLETLEDQVGGNDS